MSLKEEFTDGKTGMDNAEKAKEGNYDLIDQTKEGE